MKFTRILLSGFVYLLTASASIVDCHAATVDEIALYNNPIGKRCLSKAQKKKARCHGIPRS